MRRHGTITNDDVMKQLRAEIGASFDGNVSAFAKAAGINRTQMIGYLNGERDIGIERLLQCIAVLDIDAGTFLTRALDRAESPAAGPEGNRREAPVDEIAQATDDAADDADRRAVMAELKQRIDDYGGLTRFVGDHPDLDKRNVGKHLTKNLPTFPQLFKYLRYLGVPRRDFFDSVERRSIELRAVADGLTPRVANQR